MNPNFTHQDLRSAASTEVLAAARGLADQVDDLDWDEYSIWGSACGIDAGYLMLHHTFRPLSGECSCEEGREGMCAHIAALGLVYLGDPEEVREKLTKLSHADLVALLCEIDQRSEPAHRMIQNRLHSTG